MPQTQKADVLEEFTPQILSILKQGYKVHDLRADAIAGLTVAIVALPLSMAIAIASGVGPERGLYTAIIGGFLVSLLSGSRFQVGGPAGAFIVLVSGCVMAIGLEGLILATFLSGFMLMAVGGLRLGNYIKFIPFPVTVGFSAGIAIIILASQMRDFFGLTLAEPEPAELLHKLVVIWDARATVDLLTLAVASGSAATILLLRRYRPSWPGMLVAVAAGGCLAALGLPVETIGMRFGALPSTLPSPALPAIDWALFVAALPFAFSFALLGAVESLLSAVVADGMTGLRHRSNAELIGQGVANIGSAVFGGFCVTGTIARTATNVRAGSHGPVSGMLHAGFLLVFLLIAAPLAAYIPLASLAGVLVVVAWNMIEKEEFLSLLRISRADAAVLLVTFLLVIFRDLTEGIITGTALGGAVFIRRMSKAVRLEAVPHVDAPYSPSSQTSDIVVYRLRGAYFFGAAATLAKTLDRMADHPRTLVLDFSEVPFVDSSGVHSLALLVDKLARRGAQMVITGASPQLRKALRTELAHKRNVRYRPNIAAALQDFGPEAQQQQL